jgi:formylglycine-generating enzyme required for sulfatase activity
MIRKILIFVFIVTLNAASVTHADVSTADKKEFVNSLNMKFVLIERGDFMMGATTDESAREVDYLKHQVTLTESFYMQNTEVTQGQWKEIMDNNPSDFSFCGSCPVEMVSWKDVQEFISRLNKKEGSGKYRLPTEAEWEYAARAGSTDQFYGDPLVIMGANDAPALSDVAWYSDNACSGRSPFWNWHLSATENLEGFFTTRNCGTHRVGGKNPNAWGLYDMLGNTWEWVQDFYGDYPSGLVNDPTGPSIGNEKVIRGGGWDSSAGYCMPYTRGYKETYTRSNSIGFRLVYKP